MVQSAAPPVIKAPTTSSLRAVLSHERNILHLLVYKSKNQHRRSSWYKWLRMLKRSLERLILHLDETYPSRQSEQLSKSTGGSQSADHVDSDEDQSSSEDDDEDEEAANETRIVLSNDLAFQKLLLRMQKAIIPGSYQAFTHLITSTQYAGMAMAMLGCLARVNQVLSPFIEDEAPKVQPELSASAPSTTQQDGEAEEEDSMLIDGEEMGEVISRESIQSIQLKREGVIENYLSKESIQTVQTEEELVEMKHSEGETKIIMEKKFKKVTKKKTRREEVVTAEKKEESGTSIDDLFAGLL